MKGFFIVFEGIDGSGTSTQADLLVSYLTRNSIKAIPTCEPSEGPVGSLIRQVMKRRVSVVSERTMFDHQLAYLFAADRYDHLYNEQDGVLRFLGNGTTVVSTRYFFSSYAYHCTSEDDRSLIEDLNKRFPLPDLVIYLRHHVDVSLSRISTRKYIEAYENQEKLQLVSSNYDRLFSSYVGPLLEVDATRSIEDIHVEISTYVRGMYGD